MSSIELKIANQVVNDIGETLENFQTHAMSILSLSEKWQEMESSFTMAEASMAAREKKVELNKKEVCEIERKIEDLLCEMRIRQDKLNLRENEMNNREKVLEIWETEFDAKSAALEAKETEIDAKCEALEAKETEIDAKSEALEAREKEIEARFRVLETEIESKKVKQLFENRVSIKNKEMRELCRVMEVMQAQINEEFEGLKVPVFEGIEMVGMEIDKGFEGF